jgi:fatty acid desaturase
MKAIGILMVGLGMGRSGLLQHEGGHNSITGNPKIDKFLQNVFFGLFMSMSAKWWVHKHSRHHAMPQRIGHDTDMELMPILAAYEECITDPKSIWQNNWFLRNQFYVLMPVALATYIPVASFVLSPIWIIQHGYIDEAIALLVHYVIAIPSIGFVPYVLAKVVMGWYLLNNFSLNHTHLATANEPCHWLEYCTKHTANCTNNFFNDWFTILLNYQIEHHLFPTMPQSNLRHVVSRSKVLAAKFNLPYRVFTLFEAEMEILKHIYKVMIHIRNVCKKAV